MATFGERLKSLRESRGMTQDDLADSLGVSKQAVSQYERGVRRPDYDTLLAICDLFNVSVDYILGKTDHTARLLDEQELSLVDQYYVNPETAEVAQKIFENKELRLLFDAAQDASPEDLLTVHQMLLALKRKEHPEYDDPA